MKIDWNAEMAALDASLPERLEAIAQSAARSGLHIEDLRVMPAAGVADILYEALDEILRHRGRQMTDQTELRVIELQETVDLGDGMTMQGYEYTIQYRNETTHGLWRTVPVTRIENDRDTYQRMKDGADG
jgi:hypothetical protein